MDFRCISSFLNSPESYGATEDHVTNVGLDTSKKPTPVCDSCKSPIYDNWMLGVEDFRYHMSCLRCCVCLRTLYAHACCFIRNTDIYCKEHYINIYGTKCTGCGEVLQRSDWVQRALDMVFHLECFRCHSCGYKLTEGDTFSIKGELIVCKDHMIEPTEPTDINMNIIDDGDNVSVSSVDSDCRSEISEISVPDERGTGGKRSRAKFTPSELKVLQETFRRKQVLSADEIEALAEEVGHPKKVVTIWFQNARARRKKMLLRNVPSPSCNSRQPADSAGGSPWSRDPCSPAEPGS